jgi:hypothetical protein
MNASVDLGEIADVDIGDGAGRGGGQRHHEL